MAEEKSGIYGEMHTTMQSPDKCQCKDCVFRDRTTVTIGNEVKRIGVIRANCLVFEKETTNGKPPQFITNELPCPYHQKDENYEA